MGEILYTLNLPRHEGLTNRHERKIGQGFFPKKLLFDDMIKCYKTAQ